MDRWLLLLFFIVYFISTFAWRSWRVWRRSGINPYVLPRGDVPQAYVARAFRAVLAAIALYVSVQAAWPASDEWVGALQWLDTATLFVAGWTLLIASLACIVAAQVQMGLSWRIGIDTLHPTGLVSIGLFACSRNPIFLAMRASLAGLLLVRPNALTLAIAIAGELLMQLQVREEESFLMQQHGSSYAEYCARTPRWL